MKKNDSPTASVGLKSGDNISAIKSQNQTKEHNFPKGKNCYFWPH